MKDLEKLNKALERTRSSLRSCREFVEAQFNSIQDAMQEISQTIPKAESALGELTAQLKQHQESLDDLRERISDIERLNLLREEETATIQTQIDELDLETGSIEERITDSKERLQSLSSELRDYQTDLEDISNQTQIVERDIVEAQQESERAVSAKNLERNETEQELNKLREENAIEDFLLESIGDSQEVRFIAMLIQNSDLTVSELCSASRTSSESIAELLEALEEEGWIALRSNGTIRILKPL